MDTPNGYLLCTNASYYKFGLRGMLFVYSRLSGWVRSTKKEGDLKKEWKVQFNDLLELPMFPSKTEVKEFKAIHKRMMGPFVEDSSWKHIAPRSAYNDVINRHDAHVKLWLRQPTESAS